MVFYLYETSSKVIRLWWVLQSIKAERNGNGVTNFFSERDGKDMSHRSLLFGSLLPVILEGHVWESIES